MKVLLRKSVRGHNSLLEWNGGNGKWYPINSKNVKPQPDLSVEDPFEVLAYWRKAVSKMVAGAIEVFNGEYDREKKILIVRKL
jgi:hypothetical protein